VFRDAKPALKMYTLRKCREILDWINELSRLFMHVFAVHTQHQVATARSLAMETWLQRSAVITITQNKRVLSIFPEKPLIIGLPPAMVVPLSAREIELQQVSRGTIRFDVKSQRCRPDSHISTASQSFFRFCAFGAHVNHPGCRCFSYRQESLARDFSKEICHERAVVPR